MPDNTVVQSEQQLKKTFSFSVNGVNLGFTLRVDIKDELQAFLKLMEVARVELEKELSSK